MQDFMYSIISCVAIAIHLIINSGMLTGRRLVTVYGKRYSAFLKALLAYYAVDAAWGILAGLGWTRLLHADTVLYFIVLPLTLLLWGRAVAAYLGFGGRVARVLSCCAHAPLAYNLAALAANFTGGRFFRFDAAGAYVGGPLRGAAFVLPVAFHALLALFVALKARGSRDPVHRRYMMVALFCLVMAVAIGLQGLWPILPVCALGFLVGSCYFHVHVVVEELAELRQAVIDREKRPATWPNSKKPSTAPAPPKRPAACSSAS